MSQFTPRRTFLKSIGASATTVSLAGCSSLIGTSEFQKQLNTVRQATKKYDGNVQRALDDGYTSIQGPFVPGMGWHFSNTDYIREGLRNGPSLEKPPVLVFDQNKRLGAVEWGYPAKKFSNRDLFADENASAKEQWTSHQRTTHVFAKPDGKQNDPQKMTPDEWMTVDNWVEVSPPQPDLKPGDSFEANWGGTMNMNEVPESKTSKRIVDVAFTHPSLTTLHAWVHVENPNGVFSSVNPNFAQK